MLLYPKQITGSPSDLRCPMLGLYFTLLHLAIIGKARRRRDELAQVGRALDSGLHRKANEYRLLARAGRYPAAGELR
jgi:hypothetical protein